MNRYPLWKYLMILAIVVISAIYALPNLFGEDPAIQVSPARSGSVDEATRSRVEQILVEGQVPFVDSTIDQTGVKVRFPDAETQIRARDLVQKALGDTYVVALNLLPATPGILRAVGAKPMTLGLDLRGGVHFLLQVDSREVLKKSIESAADDARRVMREAKVRYTAVNRQESGLEVVFRDAKDREQAERVISEQMPDFVLTPQERGTEYLLGARFRPEALSQKRTQALEQNITALRNRVNELGVVEPVIQQQGEERIVVQLPGVQDTAQAKDILGRTATLQIMLVDEENAGLDLNSPVPVGSRWYRMRDGRPILLKNRVIYSGENIVDAQERRDQTTNEPIVIITLDARGAAINQRVTGENINKRMAVVYLELRSKPRLDASGKPVLDESGRPARVTERIEEVITAPVIRSQLGKIFQIEGLDSFEEARDLALLLRAGALAAPVEIIEERTVGPSLGKENIERGFNSIWVGFAAIALFMIVYYHVFGITSVLALGVNILLLIGILSILPTTLTLPGMAGIALTVGMAIDANVLVNERIREELRNGNSPHASIAAGYDRAWGTILDSNVTTLIAGVALFAFGSGPIRGFAVVLCLGILTSMFSAVVVSRALVNLIYGSKPRLKGLSIGNTRWDRSRTQAPNA
jgi:preprotein translocase subunit SecD